MKSLFLLLISASVFVACNNPEKAKSEQATAMNTDLLQQNLKGSVKTIMETSSTIDSSGKEKSDSLANYISFNQKGYQTEYLTKNSTGTNVTEQYATRNDSNITTEFGTKKNGKIIFHVVTDVSKDGKYLGGKRYDSTGKQDGYYKDLMQNEYLIVYAGKLYDMNNKLIETFDMKYDKNHFLGGKTTDSTGKTNYDGKATVNDKGDVESEEYTTLEKGISKSEKKTYKYDHYDDKGNWTQRTTYDGKGKPTQIVKRSITYY